MSMNGQTAYVCELAWLPTGELGSEVVVEVDDGRFVRVEPGGRPPDGASRLTGLTLPGFANAHSHAFHRALRGAPITGTGRSGPGAS